MFFQRVQSPSKQYQEALEAQQARQAQVDAENSSYMCCGNPFVDLFDAPNPTQDATPYKQQQTQDWNNPFPNTHSPYSTDEGRYLEDTSRAEEDSRSIGTRRSTYSTGTRRSTYTAASSSMDGKSLTDIKREHFARNEAMRLQEDLVASGEICHAGTSVHTSSTHTSVLATDEAARRLARKQTQLRNPEVNAKSAAINATVMKLQKKAQDQKAVTMTQTTRHKKELTPEDVRDPETVPGMKSKADIDKEDKAKEQGLEMISNGEYRFDASAIIAFFTNSTKNVTREDKANVSEIV